MIVGDPGTFAIESGITQANASLGLRALGFFVIHVAGARYGVYESNATMMANSFDEVQNRIARRGLHTAPFAEESDPGKIAAAFRDAIYADEPDDSFFSLTQKQFHDLVYSQDQARLIAFKSCEGGLHDPLSLRDVRISAEDYYRILDRWQAAFLSEWEASPKKEV